MIDPSTLDYSRGGGLVTVVTQDAATGQVLMVAHADREAVEYTIATGEMHYRSRRRGLWHKGATSGNRQRVVSLTADCDGDAILARVIPLGPACHTGSVSCFADDGGDGGDGGAADTAPAGTAIAALDATIQSRATAMESADPATGDRAGSDAGEGRRSYTQRLLYDRNLRLKKLGEEAAELVTACADGDTGRAEEEAADLLYHLLVALRAAGGTLGGVERILAERALAGALRR